MRRMHVAPCMGRRALRANSRQLQAECKLAKWGATRSRASQRTAVHLYGSSRLRCSALLDVVQSFSSVYTLLVRYTVGAR
jgi:hypothetical protein